MKNKPYFITYKLNNYFLKNPLYRVAVAHSYALLDGVGVAVLLCLAFTMRGTPFNDRHIWDKNIIMFLVPCPRGLYVWVTPKVGGSLKS